MKMKRIRNQRELQMLKYKLKYEEKILQRDLSVVSADVLAGLNGKLQGVAFDIGSRLVFYLISSLRKSKK